MTWMIIGFGGWFDIFDSGISLGNNNNNLLIYIAHISIF